MNKVKIKITAFPTNYSVPAKILLQKLCHLRTSEKLGDIETVNHYQLGQLNYQGVQYEKLA